MGGNSAVTSSIVLMMGVLHWLLPATERPHDLSEQRNWPGCAPAHCLPKEELYLQVVEKLSAL